MLPLTMRVEYSSRKKYGGRRFSDDWLSLGDMPSIDMAAGKPGDEGMGEMEGPRDEFEADGWNDVGDGEASLLKFC